MASNTLFLQINKPFKMFRSFTSVVSKLNDGGLLLQQVSAHIPGATGHRSRSRFTAELQIALTPTAPRNEFSGNIRAFSPSNFTKKHNFRGTSELLWLL